MNEHTLDRVLQDLVLLIENTYSLIEQVAADVGYYRKRVGDVTIGDEVRFSNGWRLVVGAESTLGGNGEPAFWLGFDTGFAMTYDPQEWVDVKAQPVMEPF